MIELDGDRAFVESSFQPSVDSSTAPQITSVGSKRISMTLAPSTIFRST